jgi:hypothetical protein
VLLSPWHYNACIAIHPTLYRSALEPANLEEGTFTPEEEKNELLRKEKLKEDLRLAVKSRNIEHRLMEKDMKSDVPPRHHHEFSQAPSAAKNVRQNGSWPMKQPLTHGSKWIKPVPHE